MIEKKTTSFISVFIKGFLIFIGVMVIALATIFFVFLPSPPNRTNFRLYSMDKTQCVSIITIGNTRYIMNGNHSSIPKSNYIKLDISKITRLGDEIGICWNNGEYEWQIVNDKANIIEIKLDTLKYKFSKNWEENKFGIPNSKKYHRQNCGTIGLETMKNYEDTFILEN